MGYLEDIKSIILKNSCDIDRVIVGVWSVDCLFNPAKNGRVFKYKFLLVQTEKGLGCSYSENYEYDVSYLESLIGKDCLLYKIEDYALQVAAIDSVMSYYNGPLYSNEVKRIEGTANEKLNSRTTIIIEEAKRIVGDLRGKKVLNIGVVGDIIRGFLCEGCLVSGTDFDEEIIGKKLFDKAEIYNGSRTIEILKSVDLAVVTGMTIVTKTIERIIEICKRNKIKLIVFAETGANMGQYFVEKGVDVYIGEEYPFYIFNGSSIIRITRKSISD